MASGFADCGSMLERWPPGRFVYHFFTSVFFLKPPPRQGRGAATRRDRQADSQPMRGNVRQSG
jgi:hypothetical protein